MNAIKPMPPVDPHKLKDIEELTRLIAIETGLHMQMGFGDKKAYGFCLIMFSFAGSELTYVSNAERSDMIKALEEFIARNKDGDDDSLGRRTRYKDNLDQKWKEE